MPAWCMSALVPPSSPCSGMRPSVSSVLPASPRLLPSSVAIVSTPRRPSPCSSALPLTHKPYVGRTAASFPAARPFCALRVHRNPEEHATIQGIAEHLQREQPRKSISELL